jgi:hypothetical protein
LRKPPTQTVVAVRIPQIAAIGEIGKQAGLSNAGVPHELATGENAGKAPQEVFVFGQTRVRRQPFQGGNDTVPQLFRDGGEGVA